MPLPDNEQTNIEFVIALEEHPVLYNHNLKEYSNRNKQDKAWRSLAEKFKVKDQECKMRWRNIRSAFLRYIRSKNTTGSAAKKPYYLWEQLQFLLPYTKSRAQSGNLEICSLPQDQTSAIDDYEGMSESLIVHPDAENTAEDDPARANSEAQYLPRSGSTVPTSSLSSWRSFKTPAKKVDPLEKVVTCYFEKKAAKNNDAIANADLNFLTSLLPDVTSLPPRKKRIFKRKVIELLDDLSEDDLSSASSQYTPCVSYTPPPSITSPDPPFTHDHFTMPAANNMDDPNNSSKSKQ